jgi:hypothetical protein
MLLVTSIDRPNLSLSKDKQNGRLICLEAGAPFQRRIEHGAKGLEEGTHLSWSSPFSDYGMERVTLFTGKSSVTYRSSNSTPKGASCDLASPNCATRGCRLATQRIGIFLHERTTVNGSSSRAHCWCSRIPWTHLQGRVCPLS